MTICSRCGGTGKVSRGLVVNGVCFKCGGDGQHRPGVHANRRYVRVVQYALVNAQGHHLAINTDRTVLEALMLVTPNAIRIEVI
jgi:hypothetical protein